MIWKIIEDAPNYAINELGEVINIHTRKQLKPHLNRSKNGYWRVMIYNQPYYIHRLLGLYFIPKPEGWDTTWEVNHIDRNRDNYCLSNLEWVPHKANIKHRYYQSQWETYNFITDEYEDAFPLISAEKLV